MTAANVDDHGLTQLVSFPTRQASVLDLVVASHPDLVSNLTCSDGISGTNDHSAVSFEVNLTVKISKKNQGQYTSLLRIYSMMQKSSVRTSLEETQRT